MAGVYTLGNIDKIVRPIAAYAGTMGTREAARRKAELEAEEKRLKAAKKALEKAKKERAKIEKERKKLVGPLTNPEIADLGYSGPGHYRTAADRYGEFSTGDQAGYTDKQMDAELKANAAAEAAKLKAIRASNIEPGMPYPGADIDAEKLKFKIRQEEIEEAKKAERIRQLKTIRGFDSEAYAAQQNIDAEESKQPPIVAAAESARIRLQEQAGAVGDYPFDTLEINKERKEIAALEAVIAKKQQAAAVLEEKRRKAEYIQKQKNEAAIEKARFLDNQTLGITDARRNALLKDEVVAFGDTELTLKTILDKAIRDKAYTERVVEPEELSLFDKLKARAGGDVRVVPDFKDVRRIVSQDRATAMGEKLTPDVMRNVGDVSTQAANQIALSMYGPDVSAMQVKDVLKRIDRLVEDGTITLVNVTGIGDSMQVHAVTVDKLKEQLQDHMPGYIDSGENPVRRIGGKNGVGGILVEYNPALKKYYVLSSLAGTFSKGNMGIRF